MNFNSLPSFHLQENSVAMGQAMDARRVINKPCPHTCSLHVLNLQGKRTWPTNLELLCLSEVGWM